MKYSQMSFDVSLESERELKDNVMMAVEFACKQVDQEARKQVESRHEGYGIAGERMNALSNSMKVVGDSMKRFLRILPAGDSEAIDAASSLKNAAIETVYEAVLLAANADKVMNDLYEIAKDEISPLEDYLAEQGNDFEEAEPEPAEAAESEGESND